MSPSKPFTVARFDIGSFSGNTRRAEKTKSFSSPCLHPLSSPCRRPLTIREVPRTGTSHKEKQMAERKQALTYRPLKVMETAIMIDGGFYTKRAKKLFGKKTPKARADELEKYCKKHINKTGDRHLYRIFYYDCPPSEAVIWNPITQKNVPLSKSKLYSWTKDFHEELSHKRKFALRMGELLDTHDGYTLKAESLKALMSEKKTLSDLGDSDLSLCIHQKGVDMKLGLDVASLAYEGIVNQIIMIAGDSDFVPAAKMARRHGIDFILDPLWNPITPSLNLHIDGLEICCPNPHKMPQGKATSNK